MGHYILAYHSIEALYFVKFIPALRVTTRTDERPLARATTRKGQPPPGERERHLRLTAFGKAVKH